MKSREALSRPPVLSSSSLKSATRRAQAGVYAERLATGRCASTSVEVEPVPGHAKTGRRRFFIGARDDARATVVGAFEGASTTRSALITGDHGLVALGGAGAHT